MPYRYKPLSWQPGVRPQHCVAGVNRPGAVVDEQCSRKRGHGPDGEWCKQHGKEAAAEQQPQTIDLVEALKRSLAKHKEENQ